jgi:hypothetical protein
MADHCQPMTDLSLLLSFVHQDFLSQGDHDVNNLCQFYRVEAMVPEFMR